MAKKMRLTQEEEVIRLLTKEGFREISTEEIQNGRYKNLQTIPDCFYSKVSAKTEIRNILKQG